LSRNVTTCTQTNTIYTVIRDDKGVVHAESEMYMLRVLSRLTYHCGTLIFKRHQCVILYNDRITYHIILEL
jgi:hypothetical protein